MVAQHESDDVLNQKKILELFGTLDWDDSHDYKSERGRG